MGGCRISHMSTHPVWSDRSADIFPPCDGTRSIDHLGSVHNDHELAVLMTKAQ